MSQLQPQWGCSLKLIAKVFDIKDSFRVEYPAYSHVRIAERENVKMDDILLKLDEKLAYSVQKLRDGTHDDHDILPSLFWTLLEYNRNLRTALEKLQQDNAELANALSSVNERQENNATKLDGNIAALGGLLKAESKQLNEYQETTTNKLRADILTLTDLLKTESDKFKDLFVEPVGHIRAEIQTAATELHNTQKVTVANLTEQLHSGVQSLESGLGKLQHILSENTKRQMNFINLYGAIETVLILALIAIHFR